MKIKAFFALTLLLACLGIASCGRICPPPPCPPTIVDIPECPEVVPEPVVFRFIITNDMHGHVFRKDGERPEIGFALLKGYINALRQGPNGDKVFLLDAGDTMSGSAFTKIDYGRSIAELMSKLGYDVIMPGNHEFDFSKAKNNPDYYSELVSIAQEHNPRLAVTCQNYRRRTPPTLPQGIAPGPIVLYDTTANGDDGIRIVVAGIDTPEGVANSGSKDIMHDYDLGQVVRDDQVDQAATKANVMGILQDSIREYDRERDFVLLLSHAGWLPEMVDAGMVTGKDLGLVKNVDLVSDAHTHQEMGPEHLPGGAVYMNGGKYLQTFVEAEVTFPPTGKPTLQAWIRDYDWIRRSNVHPDSAITAELDTMRARMEMDEVVFIAPDDSLTHTGLRDASTPLGRFICRAQTWIDPEVDFVVMNSGGIRDGFARGRVLLEDLMSIFPFFNEFEVYRVDGTAVKAIFADMLHTHPTMPGYMQFYGMTVYATRGNDGMLTVDRVVDSRGDEVLDDKQYTLGINDYFAAGGDGFSFSYLEKLKSHGDTGERVIEVLRRHAENLRMEDVHEQNLFIREASQSPAAPEQFIEKAA